MKNYYSIQKDEKIPYTNRFERYKEINIECSANTISEKRTQDLINHQGVFSVPFFTTGAKLIIRNDKRHFLNEPIPDFRIGVIGKTYTEQIVHSIYPKAKVVLVNDRRDAIDKLKSNSIDAYISDEILLPSILEDHLPKDSYSIEPKAYGFSHESYGIVVYNDKSLLLIINNWIKSEGQEAKKSELEKDANYNWISERLKFLLSQDYFYNLFGFLLIFLPVLFFLLLVTHPLFIALIAKLPLFARFIKWIRRRQQRGKRSFVAPLIRWILDDETFNVVTYKANKSLVPMYIDRETVVALVKEVGQPLVYLNNQSEPSTVEVEKVAQNLAQEAEKNPHFAKVLETVKHAATEETEKWIRSAVTRAFELLKQAVDPGSSSS